MNEIIRMENITKRFPGVIALDNVDFSLDKGEVHALVGENGAGKSTLIKILSGAYQADEGNIFIDGEKINIKDPSQPKKRGIGVVYQEFKLVPHATVAENIVLGSEPCKNLLGIINKKDLMKEVKRVLDSVHLELDPRTKVNKLGIAKQQMVEICKTLFLNSRVIVMDEPTAALTNEETEELFSLIGRLRERNVSIIYISHRLEEIFEIADRVTVLRNGKTVDTRKVAEVDHGEVVRLMTGRKRNNVFPDEISERENKKIMSVKNFSTKEVKDINFDLYKGEILGIYGIMGAGRTELARGLFGIDEKTSGTIELNGKEIQIENPRDAIEEGITLLTEDRESALFPDLNSVKNFTSSRLQKFSNLGRLDKKLEKETFSEYIDRLDIQVPHTNAPAKNVSGGNQQKLLLARALDANPKILILDEPTRGIDVGAKVEVYNLLKNLANEGYSIIFISSELPEIVELSQRVLVMKDNKIVQKLSRENINHTGILQYAV